MSTDERNQSNDTKRPAVVEDKPQMRSVSMMSASPHIPLRHATMPPPLKFGAAPSMKQPSLSHTKPQQEQGGTRWRVTTPLVKPPYHEFERTHKTIKDVSSVEISKRIDESLRKASIAASFDDKEAVARANTCECLKFAVRLWQANEGVTVEIQRTRGCSFLFQQTAKCILYAAETGSNLSQAKTLPAFRPVPAIPQAEWEKSTVDGVSMVSESLQNHIKMDAHVLAIESLVELSKSSNCKAFCSKIVFSEDSMIVDSLVSLILHSKIAPGAEDTTGGGSMRRNAVNILANCLEECSIDETSDIIARFPSLTSPEVLHTLMRDLGCASTRPHCAAAACRCLTLLSAADEKARMLLQPVRSILNKEDCYHHEVLQTESNKLLQAL